MNTIPVLIDVAEPVSQDAILAIRAAGVNEAKIYEQLAIRRLKELAALHEQAPAPPGENPAPAAAASGPGAFLLTLRRMLAIFEPYELVRQVGPGKRPLKRHEWDPPKGGPPGIGIF
jgi:hypothetical protein